MAELESTKINGTLTTDNSIIIKNNKLGIEFQAKNAIATGYDEFLTETNCDNLKKGLYLDLDGNLCNFLLIDDIIVVNIN